MASEPQSNPGKMTLEPSQRLITMFRECSRDPMEAIKARLRCTLNKFLQHFRDDTGNESYKLAVNCCCEAGKWYYKILESHVGEERNRLGISDNPCLLGNDVFHHYLIACCLEISISSKRLQCDFPLLLQILNLLPYHSRKVIELVLRPEMGLPCAMVTHLTQVWEKVLDSLAWASSSPLWDDIRANDSHFPTCQQVMPSSQLEDPNRTNQQSEGNLAGVGLSSDTELYGSDEQPHSLSAESRPQKSNFLYPFAHKVYSLMGNRLRKRCAILHISDDLRLKIWTCFEHSLVHCSDLFVDRQLDQLLMCAIYIIAKLTNEEIPFKHIMKCYTSDPLLYKSVCKNVLISRGDQENHLKGTNNNRDLTPGPWQEKRGNLIYFYNEVYTTMMEHFATQFAPPPGVDTPPLSPYPQQLKASPRRWRLSSSHSIYISQYNADTTPPPTPGLCYYFNSSPPECLREINNMIKTGRSQNKSCYEIPLDQEGEGHPSAKRLRTDDQSAWQRRLQEVVNDRAMGKGQAKPSQDTKPM